MRHAAQSQLPTAQVPVRTSMQVSVHVGHKRIGAVAPGATGTAGYSEHPDYTIHSFVIKGVSSARDGAKTSIEFLIVFQKVLVHTK